MTEFTIHTAESHPVEADEVIAKSQAKFGFVPNLIGALAEAPEAAEAYLALTEAMYNSAFTPEERNVVWFTVNAYHGCHYCMAAHTGIAKTEGVADEIIDIARKAGNYPDPKLQALKDFTVKMVEKRGWVDPAEVDAFIAAGFTKRHVIDVVLAISHKTLSNYTNHIVGTPVDDAFSAFKWQPTQAAAE